MIEGPVTNLTKFGAFVQLAEGIEGMIHVSEISAEKRINHPQEVLKSGQVVQAQVLAIDPEKRNIRLSMKQLVPTGLDEYLAEHKEGDIVTGRIIEVPATAQESNWGKASRHPWVRSSPRPAARREGFQSWNGSWTRIVSSRSGLVDSNATGASISSSIRRTYLIACAGRSAQERAPPVVLVPALDRLVDRLDARLRGLRGRQVVDALAVEP